MSSQNNIVMNIATMFEGLKGDSKQKLNGVAKLFAQTFDKFAQPLGINIDKKAIKTIEDLEKKFRELGITATQVGNQISLSMKTADGKFVSTSYQYEGGTAGKGSARLIQGATVQSASYLKPTEQLRRNYENVIKARKELDSLEQKGFSKTSDTWLKAEKALDAYNTQLEETIESLKQRYNLTVDQDPDTKEFIWGSGKGQLETLGRKYQHSMDYEASKKQDTANIEAQKQAVQQYVSALQAQYREEEKLVRLQQAKAPQAVIQAQQEVVNETKRQTQSVEQQAKSSEQYAKVADKVALADKKHKQTLAELTNTAQKSVSIFGKFKETLKQVISAGLSWKIFSAITQTTKQTIETVKELDKSLVDLQIATGSTRDQAEGLLKTYNQMAKELGATTTEVANAADSWLRQGYSTEQTNELIRSSMVLSKIGQIESAEATQYLTSALKGFDIEAEKSIEIVDKLAAIDLISATNASGLAEALSRTAASASLAGVEMEQLLGYVAVVGETTQKSMSQVGESFKTIFARFGNIKAGKFVDDETGESLNDVAKVLSQFNIQLYDSQGNMKDVGGILDSLANKWKNLTAIEKNALASAIAGTRQRENFIVLMDNYGDAIKYTEEAMNSSGTAMEKYDAYLKSIEASQAKLKATFEDFSQTLVDKGIIKGFYDLASGGLQLLTLLTQFPLLLRTIISLLSVIAIQKIVGMLGKFRLGLGSTIEQIKIYIMTMRNAELRQIAIAEGLDVVAVKSKLSITWWTAIITVVTALISYYSKLKKEQQEATRSMAEEAKNTSASLEDLISQYQKLGEDGSFSTEELQQARDIQNEITDLVGKQANNLNLVSASYEEQLKLLKNIQIETAKTNAEILASASALEEEMAEGTGTGWSGFKKALPRMGEFYKNLYGTITNTNAFGELDAIISKAADKAKKSSTEYSKDILNMLEETENITNEIAVRPMVYSADQIKNFGNEIKENLKVLKEEGVISQEEYAIAIAKTNAGLKPYLDKLNAINKALKAQAENQLVIDMGSRDITNQEQYDEYINSIRESSEYSDKFKKVLIEVAEEAFPQFSGALTQTEIRARQYASTISDLKKQIETAKDSYDVLTSAIEEYNEQGYLNYDTINSILEQGSDFSAYLVDEKGHIRDNTSALEKYIKEKTLLQAIETALSYVNSFSNKTQEEALDVLKNKINSQQTAIQSNLDFLATEIQLLPYTKEVKEQIWQQAIGYLKLANSIDLNNDSTSKAKDTTEDWEKVLNYANTILDEQIDKLKEQREEIEKGIEEQIKAKEKEISLLETEKEALEDKNEEKNKEIELEELQRNLQKAQQRTMRVYHEGQGKIQPLDNYIG